MGTNKTINPNNSS